MGGLRLAPPAPTRARLGVALALSFVLLFAGLLLLDPLLGRPALPPPEGGGPTTAPGEEVRLEARIVDALDWLLRHQAADGSWSASGFVTMCGSQPCAGAAGSDHDVGVTALAALALVESGLPDRPERDYRAASRRALDWLAHALDPATGRFGRLKEPRPIYGHALATLAFLRSAAETGEAAPLEFGRKGLDHLHAIRAPGAGWGEEGAGSDTAATGWASEAFFESGKADPTVVRDLVAWLDGVTAPDGAVGFDARGGSSPHADRHYDPNETLSAVSLSIRLRGAQDPATPALASAIRRLSCDLPVWNETGSSVDFHYWHWGTRALARCRVSQAAVWGSWTGRVVPALAARQRTEAGCARGSWDPVDKWGRNGGRIYATAMNALTLAVVRRHRPSIALPGGGH